MYEFIDHWQTLMAGVLASIAGAGTIWATIKSANREIAVAQAQTKVAQRQTRLRVKSKAGAFRGKGTPFTRCWRQP
jgi:hypothetical protein